MAVPVSLTLIGAGRMGAALAAGWMANSKDMRLTIVDPAPGADLKRWETEGKIALNPEPHPSDVVVVAVKPQVFSKMASEITPWIGADTLVVSIMAGVTMTQLSDALGAARVIRAMPNTPGAIGRGVTVISTPPKAKEADAGIARQLLSPLGQVEGPVEEALMSAVTGVSGSGPAYVFLLTEAMAAAGEAAGLSTDLAMTLAKATVEGAAALQAETGALPEDLRKAVTSPGGTTQAALDVLMKEAGLASLMRDAVGAAASRERDLSRESDAAED
jgi:pyrroline-5-carboxylate reductase